MTLKQLLARRDELLTLCADVDRDAAVAREAWLPLTARERAGFDYHTRLRVIEREIAKMKERKK
jgi:hypothetical protein